MTDEMQTRDRADVRQLSDWIDREIANGVTEIELHDTRSSTVLGMWGGSALALAEESALVLVLAEEILESAEAGFDRLASATVLAIAANEPPRIVEVARQRTVLVVARGPSGIATLRLEIANDGAEPAPAPPAAVLRQALRRLGMLANQPPSASASSLLERLVGILGASDERLERISELLSPAELGEIGELSKSARR